MSSASSSAASETPTFSQQQNIPCLPVPDLAATCATYLTSVRPFLHGKDWDRTQAAVREFLHPNGQGERLQQRLLTRHALASTITHAYTPKYSYCGDKPIDSYPAASQVQSVQLHSRNNWMIDWWNHYSYLRYREPVVINVSFFFCFPDNIINPAACWWPPTSAATSNNIHAGCQRAANLLHSALQFKQMLVTRTLPVETMRGSPLCMQQYHFLFNACRIPAMPADYVKTYDPAVYNHIVVTRNNQYFVLDCDHLTTVQELEKQLKWIVDTVRTSSTVPILGALTAGHRDDWSKDYSQLRHLSSASLDLLESSTLLLCLDNNSPVTREEMARQCWHGYGQNRWFDKSVQLIVCDNGRAGVLGEHSMMDATTPASFCDFIIQHSQKSETIRESKIESKTARRLEFTINSHLNGRIPGILKALANDISQHDTQVLVYKRYAKSQIKKFSLSPDSYIQMVFQLAYAKLMGGTWAATYESAGMRRFAWGRTETCRSVSSDSVKFVQSMMHVCGDSSESLVATIEDKAKSIRDAVSTHSSYMAMCLQGKGIDRHFLGLRLSLLANEPVPALFLDPAYALSCHWTLSTSQIPSEHFTGYGWGEVVKDGFGIAYIVKEDVLQFNVTGLVDESVPFPDGHSLKEQFPEEREYWKLWRKNRVKWMRQYIEEALDDMYEVLSKATAVVPSHVKEVSKPTVSAYVAPDSNQINSYTQTSPPTQADPKLDTVSVHFSETAQLGFSLAYPSRSGANGGGDGVVGDDVGFIDFDWGKQSGGRSGAKRLFSLFKAWSSRDDTD